MNNNNNTICNDIRSEMLEGEDPIRSVQDLENNINNSYHTTIQQTNQVKLHTNSSESNIVIKNLQISYFRGIEFLDFNFPTDQTLIIGKNGIGKTTLLMALVMLFHGVNDIKNKNKDIDSGTRKIYPQEASALFCSSERKLHAYFTDLIHHSKRKGGDYQIRRNVVKGLIKSGGQTAWDEYSCSIRVNGDLTVSPTKPLREEKIRFAYATSDITFTFWGDDTWIDKDNLSTFVMAHRKRYFKLAKEKVIYNYCSSFIYLTLNLTLYQF